MLLRASNAKLQKDELRHFMGSRLRKQDEQAANAVAQSLDCNFYIDTDNFTRVYDKNRQVVGVDTEFDYAGYHYVCDEKAAIRYANRPLNTYSLELSTLDKRGVEIPGWFVNSNMVNNSYLFIWLNKVDSIIDNCSFTSEDIKEYEVALVTKEALFDYLDSVGMSKYEMQQLCYEIRNGEDVNMGNIYKDGYKLSYSEHLFEKPINILVPRTILRDISELTKRIDTTQ